MLRVRYLSSWYSRSLRRSAPRRVAHKLFPKTLVLVLEGADGQPTALGSGFVVGPAVVATNRHVIEGAVKGFGSADFTKTNEREKARTTKGDAL
jgi:S1-C subfamily serine protease